MRRYARISGVIGGSTGTNLISGLFPGILAGQTNKAVRDYSSILNGVDNLASGISSVVAGENNQAFGGLSACIGGQLHFLEPDTAAIVGGQSNLIMGTQSLYSAILGGDANVITGNSYNSSIVGGASNRVIGIYSSVIGGKTNVITGSTSSHSSIIGGLSNTIMALRSSVIGGQVNKASGNDASVIGGNTNLAQGNSSSVVGGDSNVSSGIRSTVIGGQFSRSMGTSSTVIGGDTNFAIGNSSTVLGGDSNVASGAYTYTLGNRSEAFPNGATMFGDSTAVTKRAYGQDSFTINYSGGVWITGGGLNARRGFNVYPTGDAPTSSTPGTSGDYAYKDNYLYIYTGVPTDTNRNWGRVSLSTLDGSPPSLVSNDHSVVYCGPQTTNAGNARGQFVLGYDPGNTNPYTAVVFDTNSPIITLPAGNGTYVIDAIVGIYKGSDSSTYTLKFRNTTDNADVANSQRNLNYLSSSSLEQWITMRSFVTVTASKTIQLYGAYSGSNDAAAGLGVMPTGTQISYIRLR